MKRLNNPLQRKSVRIATGGGILLSVALLAADDRATALIAQAFRDPSSILGQRSPGARGAAGFSKDKLAMVKTPPYTQVASIPGTPPSQRVLSGGRPGIPGVVPSAATPLASYPNFVSPAGSAPGASGAGVTAPGFIGPGGGLVPGGIGGGGAGGGVVPPGGGGGVTPPPPTVVPVPEPGTWAMMILGFGMIGGMMRRRARRAIADLLPERSR